MKRICTIILSVSLIFFIACGTPLTARAIPLTYSYKGEIYDYNNFRELPNLIAGQDLIIESATLMRDSANNLGYSEIVKLAKEEITAALERKVAYQNIYTIFNANWQSKQETYPEATYVWEYLEGLGYSNAVSAGIMGNLMSETGGSTLQLDPELISGGYYGICQWSKKYYPDVWYCTLEEQCNFLRDTIKYEIDSFGDRYKDGFTYEDFLKLDNPADAALAFAKCYERSHAAGYERRQDNAIKAYNYFMCK